MPNKMPNKIDDISDEIIYLDSHASTPCDPLVIEEMLYWMRGNSANPHASHHLLGKQAAMAIDQARTDLAKLLNIRAGGIIFTSGATEANQWLINSIISARQKYDEDFHAKNNDKDHVSILKNKIIIGATEHPSIIEPAQQLANSGQIELIKIPIDANGYLRLDILQKEIDEKTALISVMSANNEIGTMPAMQEISAICKKHNIWLHSDITQMIGREKLALQNIDFVTLSGHKFYGPKGIGCLAVNNAKLLRYFTPLIRGGGQQRGLRSGTLPVPLIVGFGKAGELASLRQEKDRIHMMKLSQYLLQELEKIFPDLIVNGPDIEKRLAGNLHVTLPNINKTQFLSKLNHVAIGIGSACSADKNQDSHILQALSNAQKANSADLDKLKQAVFLRFGLSRETKKSEIDHAINAIAKAGLS